MESGVSYRPSRQLYLQLKLWFHFSCSDLCWWQKKVVLRTTLGLKVQKTCSQSVMELHTNWPKFKHPKNRREAHPLWTFTIPASPLALNRSSLQDLTQPHPETTEELTPPPICLYKYWAQWHSRSENKEVTLLPSHSTYPCTLEQQKEAPLLFECRRQRREVQETGQGWGGVLTAEMAQGGTHRLGKDTPLASNKITTPIFSTPGKAMPPAAKGNSLCFLLAPGSQGCCSSSTPQLQHRPGPCQHKPTQATLSVLVRAWKQFSSWFFWILNEQNKIKVFKYFDHVGKKQYFKRQKCIYSSIFNYNAQHSANINLCIRIYLRHNSFHGDCTSPQSDIFFYIPWAPTSVVPETAKASWAAQAGQQKKQVQQNRMQPWYCLQVGPKQQATPAVVQGKSPKPLKHPEVTPEEGWAEPLKLAIHFRHNHTTPSLFFQ